MTISSGQQTPEVIGEALMAALNTTLFDKENSDAFLRIRQQILPIDTLREIDADEALTDRLLAVYKRAGTKRNVLAYCFYCLVLFNVTKGASLSGFLYQKAAKEAVAFYVSCAADLALEGGDVSADPGAASTYRILVLRLSEVAAGIARAVGAVGWEAASLLALGLLYLMDHKPKAAYLALHDGLLLVPRAEAQMRDNSAVIVSPERFKQLTDKAARTLLTLIPDL